MIRFENVTKRYGVPPGLRRAPREVVALSDVSIEMPAGGVWGVVGPNGAGKTTFFALLLGFLRASDGDVSIDDQDPRDYLRRHGAAYLPERFRVPPEWTCRAMLRAFARMEGDGASATARADAALERMGLGPHADKQAGALSRGLLQRLGLAQTLLAERDLVVLDEPTEGLDPLWRVHFREIVAEHRAAGRTLLLASHDIAEVERLADRVVLLEGGKIRRVLEAAPAPGGPGRYALRLATPSEAVGIAFPGAKRGDDLTYRVDVADPHELSARLAALLDAGAVVVSVVPEGGALEERVRDALEGAP